MNGKRASLTTPRDVLKISIVIAGETVWFTDLPGIAKLSGKTLATLRRYQTAGVFPRPLFHAASRKAVNAGPATKTTAGGEYVIFGKKLYTLGLAHYLATRLKKIKKGQTGGKAKTAKTLEKEAAIMRLNRRMGAVEPERTYTLQDFSADASKAIIEIEQPFYNKFLQSLKPTV